MTLALLVAIGIGLHNLGEGLAIGASFALGELQLGAFLIVGFMIHNVTEGLGIATPRRRGGARVASGRLAVLAAVAGAPAILGAWIGGYLRATSRRALLRTRPRARRSRWSSRSGATWRVRAPGGFRSRPCDRRLPRGVAVMYVTGVLVA